MATYSYTIWQWNCRGYRRKRGNLQQTIDNQILGPPPDVLCLQETGVLAKLSGYKSFSGSQLTPAETTILVQRNIPVVQYTLESEINHVFVEIIPSRKDALSLFILNVYSSPRFHRHRLHSL